MPAPFVTAVPANKIVDMDKQCGCGCGGAAPVAKFTRTKRGVVKGQRMRFIQGHHMRTAAYKARVYTPERNGKIGKAKRGVPLPQNSRPGSLNPMWRGDDVGYAGVHDRLMRIRGAAREHSCARCGQAADEWAVDQGHSFIVIGWHGGREKPFSPDLSAYYPLCRPCHRTADRNGGYRA